MADTKATSGGLNFTYPAKGRSNFSGLFDVLWAQISSHDHEGSGAGIQLTGDALQAGSIPASKIQFDNDEYLAATDFAGTGTVNIIKVTVSDLIEFGTTITAIDTNAFNVANNTYLTGRNNADSANINMFRVTTGDIIEAGASINIDNGTILTTGTNDITLSSAQDITLSAARDLFLTTVGSATLKLGDAAGVELLSITDSGDTEVAQINSDGEVQALNVSFDSGTNKMANYEEGTFVPALVRTSNAFTYSTQAAQYTRIGNRVFIDIEMILTNVTGSPSGDLTISGLPFTVENLTRVPAFNVIHGLTGLSSGSIWVCKGIVNTTTLTLGAWTVSTAVENYAVSPGTTANIKISGSYQTDD